MSQTQRLSFVSSNGSTFEFDGNDGVELVNLVDGLTTIPTDLIIDPRIGDGGVLNHSRRGPRRVALDLMIMDPEPMNVVSTWGRIQVGFAAGGNLHFESDYGVRQLRSVLLESATRQTVGAADDDVFTLSLLALDPWWTDLDTSTVALPIVAPTAYNAAISYNAVLPYAGGSSLIVDVVGDAPAYPDFYVRGPFTTLTVSVAGVSWILAAALGDGVEMNVNTDSAGIGGRGPKLASGGGLVDWSLLTEASRLPTLPVGPSSVVVGGAGTGANSACTVSWVSRWLTP